MEITTTYRFMKKLTYKLLSACLVCAVVFYACQTPKPTANTSKEENVFQKINQEVLANSKAYSTLGEASKKIGHRLTLMIC
jgi:carboxypeptidase Q